MLKRNVEGLAVCEWYIKQWKIFIEWLIKEWVIASPSPNVPAQTVRPDSYQRREEALKLFLWLTYCYWLCGSSKWAVKVRQEKKREGLIPSWPWKCVYTKPPPPSLHKSAAELSTQYTHKHIHARARTRTRTCTHTHTHLSSRWRLHYSRRNKPLFRVQAQPVQNIVEDWQLISSSKWSQWELWSAFCDSLL